MTAYERMRAKLWKEGLEQGRLEGEQKGEEQGRTHALREVVLKQLKLRFGSVPRKHAARIQQASVEQLERWSERIISADSVDAVLAG